MSDPWGLDPLGFVIAPSDPKHFIDAVFEREPLVVLRDDPDRFAGLLSIAAIDRVISGTDLKTGQIDLADSSRNLTRGDYIDGGGFADRGAIAHHYRLGATIILQQLHQLDPVLARFCQAMEHVFSAHMQTNIYLTPPNNQGFRTHYDNHDVFVLQISGEKAWRFYNTPVEIPFRGEGFNSQVHKTGEITAEFTLKAGDMCYVPRGLMHDARTSGDEPSLHITMGVMAKQWAELMLEAVSEVALKDIRFRRSLPPGFARGDFDRDAYRPQFREMLRALAETAELDNALELFIDTFTRSRAADMRGAIVNAQRPLLPEDRFQRRHFAPYTVEQAGDRYRIVTAGGQMHFPEAGKPALDIVLSGETFAAGALPGETEVTSDIVLRLLAYGVIERA